MEEEKKKTVDDAKMYQIVQRFLQLFRGKADKTHNHRTYDSGQRDPGALGADARWFRNESNLEKFYIIQIGSTQDDYACATVILDWMMMPLRDMEYGQEYTDAVYLGYTMAFYGGTTRETGTLYAQQSKEGHLILTVDGNQTHYIKRVIGYA